MKKWYIFLLIISVFLLSFVGCTKTEEKKEATSSQSVKSLSITKEDAVKKADFLYGEKGNPSVAFGIVKDIRIYEPQEPISIYFYSKSIKENATLKVNFRNKAFKVNETRTLKVEKDKEIEPKIDEFKASKNGIYTLTFSIEDESGKELFIEKKNVGIMPKAQKIADKSFYFGVQPFLVRVLEWNGVTAFDNMDAEKTYDITWKYIDFMGANLVRDGNIWASMEPTEGDFNFKDNDRLVNDCKKRQILLNWHMGGTPAYALAEKYIGQSIAWDKPPDLKIWLDYLKNVGEHYKDSSDTIFYELINEPNWEFFRGEPKEYTELLEQSAKLLKSINPKNVVLPGGMVMPHGDKDDKVYYKKYKELFDNKLIDLLPYHSHPDFSAFMNDVKSLKSFTSEAGMTTENAYLNECGIETDGIAQAEEVLKKANWARGNNHKGFVMFSFRGYEGGGVNASPTWGSISKINEPKELYIAYANMIKMLDGAKTDTPIYNDKYFAYLYEKSNKSILVAYKDGQMNNVPISFKGDLKYKAFDLLGNEITDGSEKNVENSPVYYVFDQKINKSDIEIKIPEFYKEFVNFNWSE
jgi:hypothetical protein